jgi:diguanylate cyclase (GGDEF)-like protein
MDLKLHGHNGQHRSIIGRWSALFDTEGQRTGFVGTMEDVTERKTLEERLVHQATHDSLTGLPNRVILNEHLALSLARAKRTNERIGVIFCDLDRFKIVNDSLGHETGDRLLKAVARRMGSALRETDVVGRFGGDEFVVLVTGPDDSAIRDAADRLQAVFAKPFDIGLGRPYASSGSIGIALSTPESTPETLLRDADVAMYRAKERGRGRAEEFDERLRARALDRLALISDLPDALANNELVLLYQPILGTPQCQLVSVEALVRWDHPTRGRLSPDVFIGLAEETGLILPIGDWILERACLDLLPADNVMLNVNLSALQVTDPGLVERIATALERTGFPGSRLMLEVTESVLMHNVEKTVETLHHLKALGVSIAVDDFGTGYSSLNYLSSFPIDSLKVDRSFIQGLGFHAENDKEIVRTVIALAHSLGLTATAEGVETDVQLTSLRLLGCDFVQGYLFDEPVTLEALRSNWMTNPALSTLAP